MVAAGVAPTHRMRQAGFEPTTFGSGGRRSIQLSYWREILDDLTTSRLGVGASGFEPPTSWSRTRRANRAALRPAVLDVQTHHTHRRTGQNGCPAAALCVYASVRLAASSLMRPGGLEPPAS